VFSTLFNPFDIRGFGQCVLPGPPRLVSLHLASDNPAAHSVGKALCPVGRGAVGWPRVQRIDRDHGVLQTNNARSAQTLAVVVSPDAISGASGDMALSISVTVPEGTPAAASASAKCPATSLKWCMVIPRPWCTCFIGAPV
jgi:hypothetical protein